MFNKEQTPQLGIACYQQGTVTETFIANHINRLPFSIRLLQGHDLITGHDGKNLVNNNKLSTRVCRKTRQVVLREDSNKFYDSKRVAFLRRNNIKVLLAEYGPVAVDVMKACNAAQVPLIACFYGFDAYHDQILTKLKSKYVELFERAAHIVAVSKDMVAQLISLGAPADKIDWIPCGVDTHLCRPTQVDKSPPTFIAAARFVEKKGSHLTLLAFASVVKRYPAAKLKMVGEGPLWGVCKQMASTLGIANNVEFVGNANHEALFEMMQEARGFVQHSIRATDGDAEGTPCAIIEAQACGLPVVSTRHMGIKDVVINNETGFLVAEGDANEMALHMTSLLKDPEMAKRLGESGRKHVFQTLTLKQTLTRLTEIIETHSRGTLNRDPILYKEKISCAP